MGIYPDAVDTSGSAIIVREVSNAIKAKVQRGMKNLFQALVAVCAMSMAVGGEAGVIVSDKV